MTWEGKGLGLDWTRVGRAWGPECWKQGQEEGGLPCRVVAGGRGPPVLCVNRRLARAGEAQGEITGEEVITVFVATGETSGAL